MDVKFTLSKNIFFFLGRLIIFLYFISFLVFVRLSHREEFKKTENKVLWPWFRFTKGVMVTEKREER